MTGRAMGPGRAYGACVWQVGKEGRVLWAGHPRVPKQRLAWRGGLPFALLSGAPCEVEHPYRGVGRHP